MTLPNFLARLFPARADTTDRTARNRPRTPRKFSMETLEERTLLTVAYNPTSGVISIVGSNQDDTVIVLLDHQPLSPPHLDQININWTIGGQSGFNQFPAWRFVSGGGSIGTWKMNTIYFYGLGGHDMLDFGADGTNPVYNPVTAYGGTGNDSLWGGAGADYLSGQDGEDNLQGDEGNDTIYGGSHNDQISGGTGNDLIHGDAGHDLLSGDDGQDTLYGDAGNDILFGGEGNDTLYGGDGDDTLHGGAGWDALFGGAGGNWLHQDGF